MTESVKNVSNNYHSNQDGTVGGDPSGWIAGIDIGGTKTLMLLSSQKAGNEVHERILPTLASDQPDEFFRWLFAELKHSAAKLDAVWINLTVQVWDSLV